MEKLDGDTKSVLSTYGFDQIPFDSFREQLAASGFDENASRTRGEIKHPPNSALLTFPELGSEQYETYKQIGQEAINKGQVGAVILNGGMATRFGGVPKGVVPVVNERSFLDFKISQVIKAGNGKAPVFLMNSFTTEMPTMTHLEELALEGDVRCFHQFVSLRLEENGDLFLLDNGKPSLYAPGHGDFAYAFRASGELERFMAQGGKWVTLSNVDNLGAGLDPVIIGMHIANDNPMSVELVQAYEGDVGGFPAIVDGNLAIMEAFRLPASFDVSSISTFNTNTFVFNTESLLNAPSLDWFAVKKNVEGKQAIQFERLVGQLTEFVGVSWLVVPREGSSSRFIPIKLVSDIEDKQAALKNILVAQGVL